MTRQEIIDKLKTGVFDVTFTKVDGTQRTITCTLSDKYVPAANKANPVTLTKVRELNEEVVVVYCPNKKEWRSFRVANVQSISEASLLWSLTI
jgi:hypothetical protein